MENLNLAERYKLLHKIGSGGCGEVYAVHDRYRQIDLALKLFVPDDSSSSDEESFFREFLLIRKLSSNNLVKVYDFGYNADNMPFYTMEFLPEENIDNVLDPDNGKDIMHFCRNLASAVSFLHFFNLIHNDLKPENIKLICSDKKTIIKLLDFGLASDFSPDQSQAKLSGTVEYMAPELFRSGQPDIKSDIYSLGVIFYKLIAGRLPFSGPDPLLVISDKLEKPVPTFAITSNENFGNFQHLICRMLSSDPDSRPSNAYQAALAISENIEEAPPFLDFNDLIISAVGIKLAKQFEYHDFSTDDNTAFVFQDEAVLNQFNILLKAYLQKNFNNILDIKDKIKSNVSSIISPKAVHKTIIDIHHLRPGQKYQFEEASGDMSVFDLLLTPKYGATQIDCDNRTISINIFALIENWFEEDDNSHEFHSRLEEFCEERVSSVAFILNDMQSRGILKFNGKTFDIDNELLTAYSIPKELITEAVTDLRFLSEQEKSWLHILALLNHSFDLQLVKNLIGDICPNPGQFLASLVQNRILEQHDRMYRFISAVMRAGLADEISKETSRQLHFAAAESIEKITNADPLWKAANLAIHYTEAEKIDESVRWTRRAINLLMGDNNYKSALKIVNDSLGLVMSAPQSRDNLNSIGILLASRGEIENKLGQSLNSLSTFAKIIRMKRVLEDQELIAQAYKHLGDIYKSKRDYRRGLKALNKALDIYKQLGNQIEISHTFNNIGNIHWVGSQIDKALENYNKALKIQEKQNLLKDVASTLSNIGGCLLNRGRYDDAISHYKRSMKIKKQINDLPELARTYNNLGAVYYQLGNIPEALKYLYDSLRINRQIDSRLEILNNIANIAECEESLGHYQQALALSKEELELSQELSNLQFEAFSRLVQARIALKTGQYGDAEQILEITEKFAKQITDQFLEYSIFMEKSQLYLELNQPELFLKNADKATEIAYALEDKANILSTRLLYSSAYLKLFNQPDIANQYLSKAFEMNKSNNSENTSCRIFLQEFAIFADDPLFSREKLDSLQKLLSHPVNHVLNSEFLYHNAQRLIKQNSYDDAIKNLFEASTCAEKYSKINILWRIKYLTGLAEREKFNYEEAYLNFRQSVAILKSLGQSIKNQKYMQSFLQQPEVALLKRDIKELAQRMGKNNKAAYVKGGP